MRQPLGLGLASGVVAADGAIARRRRATVGGMRVGLSAGSTIYMSGAILSKPLTYYAWQRGAGIYETPHILGAARSTVVLATI
jgi:hypothetical protein